MAKRGKKYTEALKQVDTAKLYSMRIIAGTARNMGVAVEGME